MDESDYRYEATSVDGFVAQVVRYVASGYYFYVRCLIPEHKDPQVVDAKLLARYQVCQPRWRRERRRLKQNAGVHYLRHNRLFVLMLTKGRHEAFYADHGQKVIDIRRIALKAFGYSIRYAFSRESKRWKVSVRLDEPTYRTLRAHMLTMAAWESHRCPYRMEREFSRLPYQPYSPVYRQLVSIAKAVNRPRKRRGFAPIDYGCIPNKKRLTKVFVEQPDPDHADEEPDPDRESELFRTSMSLT